MVCSLSALARAASGALLASGVLASGAAAAVAPPLSGNGALAPKSTVAVKGTEVPSLATSKSRTWRQPDGGYVTRVFGRAVNEKDASGRWRAIDTTLRADGSGALVGLGGKGTTSLPAVASGPVVVKNGSSRIALSLTGAAASPAKVDGSSATYVGVGRGVDARLTAGHAGAKEDLILSGADSQNVFSYDVDLSGGLSLRERKDGGADAVDGSGEVVFAIAAPLAVDAKGAVASGQQATLTVKGSTITVALDQSWLSADGRAFPVTLDPSTTMDASRDCYLDGDLTTTNYCSAGELWAGNSTGHDHKALTYFSVAGTVPETALVQQAQLHLYPLYQTSPGTSKTLAAHRVTADWDASATWVKRTASANWGTAGGDIDAAKLDPQPVPGSGVWSDFTVTDTVNGWLAGTTPNQGLAVTDDGSTANNSVVYASVDNANSDLNPWLEIEWYPNTGKQSNWTLVSQKLTDRSSLGVNVAGGNLLLSSSDLQVASTGLPVSVNRFYNSQSSWLGMTGAKGRLSIGDDLALYECDDLGSRCLVGLGETRTRFTRNADGTFNTPAGVGNVTLTRATPTSGRFTLTENGSGVKYGFFDNAFTYVDTIDDRNGNHLGLTYGGSNNALTKITDSRGRQYNVTANSSGLITSISVPTSVIAGGQTWTYGYTGDLLTSVTDPENKTTTYTYNGDKQLTKITDPRSQETIIAYNGDSEVASITRKVDGTTANDVTTTFAYTTTLTTKCTTNVPATAKITGQTTVTDPRGKTTTYCFDMGGQVLWAVDDANRATTTTYNPQGNSTKFDNFYGGSTSSANSTSTYDPSGQNPMQLKDAAGSKTSFGYPTPGSTPDAEKAAHPTSVTEDDNKNGGFGAAGTKNVTNFSYNATYQVTQVQSNTSGLKATMTYNADGQIATAKDGNNNVTTYGYDATTHELNLVTPQPLTPAGGIGQTKITYDGLSRVKTVTNGYTGPSTGKTITYGYDKLGRTTSVSDSDGQTTTFTWDGDGNLTARTTGTQTTSYVYDKLNRKTSETFPGSVTNTYTYDKASNLATLTDPSGTVSYTYDGLNRTESVTSATATTGTDKTTFTYNDPNTPGATSTTSNVIEKPIDTGTATIKRTADLAGKLIDVTVKNTSGVQTLRRGWDYASSIAGTATNGQLVVKATDYGAGSTAVTTTSYAYGDNGQLAEAQTVNGTAGSNVRDDVFTYDGAGNRTKKVTTSGTGSPATTSYAYNADNQLCWSYSGTTTNTCATAPTGATSFGYDAAGNQTTQTGASTLAWDARLRLKTIGSSTVTHLSPNNNELTAIGSDAFHNTAIGTTRVNAGGTLAKLVRDPGTGGVVSQVKGSAKSWLVTDQLGSTIALVDSSGNVVRSYSYDTDGNATSTGSGSTTPITFAGGHDVGNGLIHFGARYYQPSVGRWTQPDPLDQPGDLAQMNRYLYVGNNPINGVDPSGLLKLSVSGDFAGLSFSASVDDSGRVGVGVGKGVGVGGDVRAELSGGKVKTGASASVKGCVGGGVVGCASYDGKDVGYSVGVGSTGASAGVSYEKRIL